MNQNSIEFVKGIISHTINKIYGHVSRLDVPNEDKTTIAFKLYEAHINAIVAHMVRTFVEEEYYHDAIDEITSTINSYIKSFIGEQQSKQSQLEH